MPKDRSKRGQRGQQSLRKRELVTAVPPDKLPATSEQSTPSVAGPYKVTIARETRLSKGPLPDPMILGEYDKVLPGAAERILSMAEREQAFAHEAGRREQELEGTALNYTYQTFTRGQRYALAAVIAISCVSVFIAYCEAPGSAAALMGGALASVVGAFIWGRKAGGGAVSPPQGEKDQLPSPANGQD